MSIEKINRTIEFVKQRASDFGARAETDSNKSYVERKNVGAEALKDGGAYYGLIPSDEEVSGPYHDFSFTVMPTIEEKAWVVDICVGSMGFRNDYELATYPGIRRLFSTLVDENGYCKSDFADIETNLPKEFAKRSDIHHLSNTIGKYSKFLSACQIVEDPENDFGRSVISAFIAGYSKIREWPSNQSHRTAVQQALKPFQSRTRSEPVSEIEHLLNERKYIVLQGPPGTGKTRTAKLVAKRLEAETFFTQFHAETSFSDFIHGIRPNLKANGLGYVQKLGSFSSALQFAKDNPEKKVILIIDEINRANLSNVLGPIFYLFEHKMDNANVTIEVAPGLEINKLPENFYVLATMNTADRSLAVVDFALRRRFAWYALKPEPIASPDFMADDFKAIDSIFNWHASSEELSLQPGQGYFFASTDDEMKNRIRYEIFPLIKEYLQEGLMKNAKEEFNNYFASRIKMSLFD
jgi:5-methylcytosine-specific restriction enzyme B